MNSPKRRTPAVNTVESRLADEIANNDLYLLDGDGEYYRLSAHDRGVIVVALRCVGTAKEELIRESELTRRNFSID